MRNLKRALSLALATVMTLGLMVVGTGAVGYDDVTSEHNEEAIEVLQAVGIMSGVSDTDFDPDGLVTRNQMAVIMSQLLNLDYDYYRGVNPFTDVPSWAAPYVAACAAEGVTAGIGDGLYGGDNNVTAAQAALMILKALGYFQYQADFDSDWQISTVRQASYIGLFDGIDASAEQALTRNQIAQLVLNGLKSDMVYFTGDVGITVNGVVIGHKSEYTSRTSADDQYDAIAGGTSDIISTDQYIIQLGEELYNGDLRLDYVDDVFGRPSRLWEYDGVEIGTYVREELLREEYTVKVTGRDLYNLLGSNVIDTYRFTITVDGETEQDVLDGAYFTQGNLVRSNTDGIGATGNGVLTQVYVDNSAKNPRVNIAIINTYLAVATDDYDDRDEEASFDVYAIADHGKDQYVKTADETVDFDVANEDINVEDVLDGDIVLVTVADGAIQTIADPEVLAETGIDAFKVGSWLEVSGTPYDYASTAMWDTDTLIYYTGQEDSTNLKDATYNVYLDPYGYVIGLEEIDPADNYLFITGIDSNASYRGVRTADASAIFLDGSMETIEVDVRDSSEELSIAADTATANAIENANRNDGTPNGEHNYALVNAWFTYTVDSNGVYTLKYAAKQGVEDAEGGDITIDKTHITRVKADGNFAVANDETVFLNVTTLENVKLPDSATNETATIIDDVDSVTVGAKNVDLLVKNVTGATNTNYVPLNEIYTLYNSSNWVIAVVVIGEDQGTSSNYAYVTSDDVKSERYSGGVWTWVREVVINGELTDITYVDDSSIGIIEPGDGDGDKNNAMDQGYWYKVTYYADGTVKKVEALKDHFDSTAGSPTYSADGDEFIEHNTLIEDTYDNADPDVAVLWMDDAMCTVNSVPAPSSLSFNEQGSLYLYDTDRTGFSVSPDVKVVVANAGGKNDKAFNTVEDGYTGYSGLKRAIADLNNNFTGDVSAILENGIATSIIFNCVADDGYDEGETTPAGEYSSVVDPDVKGAAALNLKDNARVDNSGHLKLPLVASENVSTQIKDAMAALGYTDVSVSVTGGVNYTINAVNADGDKETVNFTLGTDETKYHKLIVDGELVEYFQEGTNSVTKAPATGDGEGTGYIYLTEGATSWNYAANAGTSYAVTTNNTDVEIKTGMVEVTLQIGNGADVSIYTSENATSVSTDSGTTYVEVGGTITIDNVDGTKYSIVANGVYLVATGTSLEANEKVTYKVPTSLTDDITVNVAK